MRRVSSGFALARRALLEVYDTRTRPARRSSRLFGGVSRSFLVTRALRLQRATRRLPRGPTGGASFFLSFGGPRCFVQVREDPRTLERAQEAHEPRQFHKAEEPGLLAHGEHAIGDEGDQIEPEPGLHVVVRDRPPIGDPRAVRFVEERRVEPSRVGRLVARAPRALSEGTGDGGKRTRAGGR